ncbi:MAG: DUF4278 domain-containing protein [Cyanobacteria bacterium J06626_23]
MQLSYRGVKYSVSQSPVEVVDAPANGTYRGATYRIKQASASSVQAHPQGLKYRGAVVR